MTDMSAPSFDIPSVTVGAELGRGSFGGVYRGRHRWLDVDVAVKAVDVVADAAALEMALHEAQLMARLDHPNLLRIYDAGHLQAGIYLVLELMDGTCTPLRHLPPDRAMNVARQLLLGLQSLHDARILHRDIKPANCLIRHRDGRVKLADLGIAIEQSTRTEVLHQTAGTVPFMAPELFEPQAHFSATSDMYALGMTLACLLLDEDPFPRVPLPALVTWSAMGERPRITSLRPDLPRGLTTLVERMMASRRCDRPQSVAEALAALNDTSPAQRAAVQEHTGPRIGPWVLGEQNYSSSNWAGWVVTHAQTGVAARLTHLQQLGPLARSSDLILASAERASQLGHPAIVDVLDWGLYEGRAFVVTAPQGLAMDALIQSSGPRPEYEALQLALALAEALCYLHERGLVYQLVEPGSATVSSDARSVQLRWPVFCVPRGTPAVVGGKSQRALVTLYAAPETIENRGTIEPAADLYGLGEVLFFLLAGQAAFAGQQATLALLMAKTRPPDLRQRAPLVTAPTARLVASLLASAPEQRPADARTVVQELHRLLHRLAGEKTSGIGPTQRVGAAVQP